MWMRVRPDGRFSLRRRQNSDPDAVIYSGQAIECGDSVNRKGTTMDDEVADGILIHVNSGRTTIGSPWCPKNDFKKKKIIPG